MSVTNFPTERRVRGGRSTDGVDSNGGPPDDPRMEERIKKLEVAVEKTVERLTVIERDLAIVKSNYATTTTVSEAKNSIIMWVVGAIFVAQLLPILKDFLRPVAPASASSVMAPQAPAPAPSAAK